MLDFVKRFTDKEIKNVIVKNNKYYQVNDSVKKYTDNDKINFIQAGIFLGEKKDNQFIPSMELIRLISKISTRKVIVTEKAEWRFLNAKDVMGKGIVKAFVDSGYVLVENRNDENIGFGKFIASPKLKEQIVIKNKLDRGNYLRIER